MESSLRRHIMMQQGKDRLPSDLERLNWVQCQAEYNPNYSSAFSFNISPGKVLVQYGYEYKVRFSPLDITTDNFNLTSQSFAIEISRGNTVINHNGVWTRLSDTYVIGQDYTISVIVLEDQTIYKKNNDIIYVGNALNAPNTSLGYGLFGSYVSHSKLYEIQKVAYASQSIVAGIIPCISLQTGETLLFDSYAYNHLGLLDIRYFPQPNNVLIHG